jgi:hypothetical protein
MTIMALATRLAFGLLGRELEGARTKEASMNSIPIPPTKKSRAA